MSCLNDNNTYIDEIITQRDQYSASPISCLAEANLDSGKSGLEYASLIKYLFSCIVLN